MARLKTRASTRSPRLTLSTVASYNSATHAIFILSAKTPFVVSANIVIIAVKKKNILHGYGEVNELINRLLEK